MPNTILASAMRSKTCKNIKHRKPWSGIAAVETMPPWPEIWAQSLESPGMNPHASWEKHKETGRQEEEDKRQQQGDGCDMQAGSNIPGESHDAPNSYFEMPGQRAPKHS